MFCHFHGVILSGCCLYSYAFYKRLFHSHYIVIKGNFLCVNSVCSAKSPTCINLAILSSFSWEITHLNGITMFVDLFPACSFSCSFSFLLLFSYRFFSCSHLFLLPSLLLSFSPSLFSPPFPLFHSLALFPCSLFSFGMFFHGIYS